MTDAPGLHDLLPFPRRVEAAPGSCRLGRRSHWNTACQDERVTRAAVRLREERLPHEGAGAAPVTIVEDSQLALSAGAYRLSVREQGIHVTGQNSAACFHALQTLAQLLHGRRGEVPCCTITDWPDFPTRGLLHDVTRGKCPTLATLRQMADRLAALKLNQLQLYIEHSFVFSFDPDICGPEEGLTPDEVRDLDAYCRERFIDLVPAVANLGHMGRILAMPKYRHLAEIETADDWEAMPWPRRLRGMTLDAANPEAQRLVERMWGDVFDAFSSPVVNICGDEPWDLGEGKNKERCARDGKAELYLGHLRRMQDLCAGRGRTTQLWGDVVRNYPHLLHRLRPDGAILHWGYDDKSDYVGTATFVASGLPTMVCPGTSGWKRTLNALSLAERNIRTFAAVGRRDGAAGLINTDWGDHGHFNLLAGSWHGITLGACCAWRSDHVGGSDFDKALIQWAWSIDDPALGPLLRAASALADECETWKLLWTEDVSGSAASFADPVRLESTFSAAYELANIVRSKAAELPASAEPWVLDDLLELGVAAEFTGLAAEKLELARLHATRAARGDWGERLLAAWPSFARCWLARNKHHRLGDIEMALRRVAAAFSGMDVPPSIGRPPAPL